jgi:hypothetical protein
MYHPPFENLDTSSQQEIEVLSKIAVREYLIDTSDTSMDEIDALLLQSRTLYMIQKFNAHDFRSGENEAFQEQETVLASKDFHSSEKTALFYLASKAQHSCFPNVQFSTKTGLIKYIATRPIAEGDRICLSYIGNTLNVPRVERQELLLRTKMFRCDCELCSASDWCRPLPCLTSTCKGICFPNSSGAASNIWACGICQKVHTEKSILTAELLAAQMLASIPETMRPGVTEAAAEARKCINIQLPSMHYLQASAAEKLATMCASQAAMMEQLPFHLPGLPSVETLRFRSAIALLEVIVWRERMSALVAHRDASKVPEIKAALVCASTKPRAQTAKKKKGKKKTAHSKLAQHEVEECQQFVAHWLGCQQLVPCWESGSDALFCGADLEKSGAQDVALLLYRRYFLVLETTYHPDDEDVTRIRELLVTKK